MKAIIDLAPRGSVFSTAAKQLAEGMAPDFHLHFESARALFSELTPASNYSNVHGDVAALEALGLVVRNVDESVSVPFESVEIRLRLADVAA